MENRVKRLAERIAKLSAEKRSLFRQRMDSVRLTGSELVARSLYECGITHVYGVSGEPSGKVLAACPRHNIRPLGVYHQTAAVCMALAHNYQAGGLVAATLVSAGPAATNAITGLLVAHDNCWPVVVLGARRTSFQRCDVLPMVREVTKQTIQVTSPHAIREAIHEARQTAVSGRPGPVYVDLQEDVFSQRSLAGPCRQITSSMLPESVSPFSPTETDRVAATLVSARRPALLLGKGVRWTLDPNQLKRLVEALDLPVITSPMGRGFVPDDHPLCFNRARGALQSQADAVLILGARLNWMFRHGTEISREAKVFRVDIHRDEEDEAAIATEFILADAGDFVTRLLRSVERRLARSDGPTQHQSRHQWLSSLRAVRDHSQRTLDQCSSHETQPMSTYQMMSEVRDALPRDAICVTEGNVSMRVAQVVIPAYSPASRMDAGTNACMGVGIPFAIGAKVACPDRPVVVVTGDYGFSLSAMELEVCVRHRVPIVVVVANNQGNNGALRQKLFQHPGAELVTMFQPGLEYDRIMTMFGGQGTTIRDPRLIRPAVERAISSGTPCCINVVTDPEMEMPNAWGIEDHR